LRQNKTDQNQKIQPSNLLFVRLLSAFPHFRLLPVSLKTTTRAIGGLQWFRAKSDI
jgi:hypothetical protein